MEPYIKMEKTQENNCRCSKERELGVLIESSNNFKEFMDDIKTNHLVLIYRKLEEIREEMSSRRPSWPVAWIIATLTSLCGILVTNLIFSLRR